MKQNTKKVLFSNDGNGHEYYNPYCTLVEIDSSITKEQMYKLEISQLGVLRRGGCWQEIMEDGNIQFTLINSGRFSEYKKEEYDELYKLISGNY